MIKCIHLTSTNGSGAKNPTIAQASLIFWLDAFLVVLTPSLTALAVVTVVSRRPFVLSNLLLYTFNLQHFHFWVIYDETLLLFTYLHNPFFLILELSKWWKTCTRFPSFQTSPKERRRSKLQMRRSQSMDLDDHHEESEESEAKVFKLLSETDIQVEFLEDIF